MGGMYSKSLLRTLVLFSVWSLGESYLSGLNVASKIPRIRAALSDDQADIGHIYQYTGQGPPAELAKLFGIKINTRTKTKGATVTKRKETAAKAAPVANWEPVDELESELLRKYGGSKKRIDGPIDRASRAPDGVRGFDPLVKAPERKSKIPATSREDMMRKWEGKSESTRDKHRSAVRTGKSPPQAEQVVPTQQAPPSAGFRLRPPPPIDPAELAKRQAKEDALAERAKLFQQKLQVQHQKNKELFTPFHFRNIPGLQVDEQQQDDELLLGGEDSSLFSTTGFDALGITDPIVLQNLEKMQVLVPTQIQALAIPALLKAQQNVILQAQTGSGKTLAYLLPLVASVDTTKKQVQVLILAPSRELVQQIGQVASTLFAGTACKSVTLIGGANVQNQIKHLREDRPQIVIATPGRLAELVFELEKLRLGSVHTVIIDEVDHMLKDPYIGEVETLLQATPFVVRKTASPAAGDTADNVSSESVEGASDSNSIADNSFEGSRSRQLLCLVSATSHDPAVTAFADRYQTHNPHSTSTGSTGTDTAVSADNTANTSTLPRSGATKSLKIAVSGGAMLPRTITHGLISTPRMRSLEFLKRFLNARPAVQRALIFVNDPRRVEGVVKELGMAGIIAAPLHGETSKDDRKEILSRLKDGRLKLVVATEMAARGLDIPELTHVINYELPTDAEHYVHRTGRCGRAGREGLVMNFASPETKFVVRRFGKKLGVKVLDCEIRDNKVFLKRG